MGIPQVPAQVKRAPVLALRAVFAGFGRLLMAADRPPPAMAFVADVTLARDLPNNGGDATGPESRAAAETSRAAALPLPNYDGLSLASIRARLRGLDVAQLKVLLDYEATNAERTDVLGMFERRIEKLEAGP
jgi:hypothetical protein